MEKTQTDAGRAQRRNARDLVTAGNEVVLALDYLTRREFMAHQARCLGMILGAVAFGERRPRVATPDCSYAWVDMPVLNDDSVFEVWTCAQPVVREDAGGLASAGNEDILFGCLQIKQDCRLDAATFIAYSRIFDFIDRRGYCHLLRVWNYIPQIHADEDGLERYARFNVGRHDAFTAKRRVIGMDAPAASALGSRGTDLVIYFLAARKPGQVVENPRQTSAFNYPAQYGPRSPTFARAMLMQTAGTPQLFISGTASIVGHATLHRGDVTAQAQETVANILAVIAQARRTGLDAADPNAELLLKIYLRHAGDLAAVRHCLLQTFGAATNAVYLRADICRADLLMEVEAVYPTVRVPLH